MHYESFYGTNLLFFGLIPRHFEKTRVPGLDFNDVWILLRHTTSLVIGKFLSHGKILFLDFYHVQIYTFKCAKI